MAPEYAMDGIYSEKSDVFSFGVVILEIITGQKNRGFTSSDLDTNILSYVSLNQSNSFFKKIFILAKTNIRSSFIEINQILISFVILWKGVRNMEEGTGHKLLDPNMMDSSSQTFKLNEIWSHVCSRICRGQTNDVMGCFDARE